MLLARANAGVLRTVVHPDAEVEVTAVHDERPHLKKGPFFRVVEVGKAHKVVGERQHIGLVKDDLLQEADIIENEGGRLALIHEFTSGPKQLGVVEILPQFFSAQALDPASRFRGDPVFMRAKALLYAAPLLFCQLLLGRAFEQWQENLLSKILEPRGVMGIDGTVKIQHAVRPRESQRRFDQQGLDGGRIGEIDFLEM